MLLKRRVKGVKAKIKSKRIDAKIKRKAKNLAEAKKDVNLQCFYSKPNPNQMVIGFCLP